MTYESLSLLLSHLLAAAPGKDAWDIAEAVGSIVTAVSAFAVAVAAFVALRSWRTQTQYERRLQIASDFTKGLHDIRIGFLILNSLTKDDLLLEPENSDETQKIEKISNEVAKPIRNRVLEMRSITVQADILGMPEFEDLMKSVFRISDKYLAVLQTALLIRKSTPKDREKIRLLEMMINESGYFERFGIPLEEDPLDQEIEKIEDEARDLCRIYLKTRKAWYRR